MEALEVLGIDFKIIFVQIVGFLILYWVLNRFLFSRVKDVLTKRKEEIGSVYAKNETERQNIEQLREGYERTLSEIRIESEKIINEGRAIAENVRKEIIDNAHGEATQILTQTKEQIEREKERAIMELQGSIVDLSVTIASKVIQKSLSQEEHLKIIRDYMPKIEGFYGEG